MQLYVVQVTHRVGPETSGTQPIIITGNPAVALTAAFGTDMSGYRLLADGDGAQIFRLQADTMELAESLTGDEFSSPRTLVFARIRDQHTKGGWSVNWYDKELERLYSRVFDRLTA